MGANYRGYNPVTGDDIWTIAGEQQIASGGELVVESGGVMTIESGGSMAVESGGSIEIEKGGAFGAYCRIWSDRVVLTGEAIGAALRGFQAWIEVEDGATITSGALVAGFRSIIYAHDNDLSAIAGGGESALFYGQTWGIGSGAIDHGIAVIAGAGTTIRNAVHAVGTIDRLFDFSDVAGVAEQHVASWPTRDAIGGGRQLEWFMGDLATRAEIRAEIGDLVGEGSMYFSSTGEIFMKVASTTADTDWAVINHEDGETG